MSTHSAREMRLGQYTMNGIRAPRVSGEPPNGSERGCGFKEMRSRCVHGWIRKKRSGSERQRGIG